MTSYLASSLLMGTLAVLVLVALVRSRRWYRYSPRPDGEAGVAWAPDGDAGPPLLERPEAWIAAFFGLALLAVGGVFAFVTSPAAPDGLLSVPVLVLAGLLLGPYLLLGVYTAAKGRGHPSSVAAAETATVLGALFLVAVTLQLVG